MSNKKHQKQPFDALAKIAVIGDTSVGKTNLLLRFVSADYHMSHISTIGIDFKVKTLTIDNFKLKLQIWDTAGQERYRNLTGTVYQGAHAILLTYAINDRKSFQSIEKWMIDVKNHAPDNTVIAIVGNKWDLQKDRVVKKQQGQTIAKKFNALFFQTSAKQNVNVQQLFTQVGKKIKNNLSGVKKSNIKETEQKQHSASKKEITPKLETPPKANLSLNNLPQSNNNNKKIKLQKQHVKQKENKKKCC